MSTTEKELFRGLLRHDQLLSVEPASHNAQSEDIVRWHTRPHVIGAWEQVRVHAPDPETPELLAVDFVAAGKRLAIDEDGQMHLNPLTAWGRYEAFRGGQWADGQEFVIRRADVSRGGVTFTLVTV